jgi:hypothetical protein
MNDAMKQRNAARRTVGCPTCGWFQHQTAWRRLNNLVTEPPQGGQPTVHFPRNGNERRLRTSGSDSGSHAQRERMRRLFARRGPLAAFAPVFDLRACRVLRLFAEQARDETLPRDESSADSFLRAGRRVGVVLRRRTLFRIALTSFGVQAIVRGLSRPTNTGGISLNWPLHENGVLPPEISGEKARSSSASSTNPASNIS